MCCPNSLKSALVPWFAKIPLRTGWLGEMRYLLLNDPRKLNKQAFPRMVERYVALAGESVTSAQALPDILPPQLRVDTDAQQQALAEFSLPSGKLIGLLPPGRSLVPPSAGRLPLRPISPSP